MLPRTGIPLSVTTQPRSVPGEPDAGDVSVGATHPAADPLDHDLVMLVDEVDGQVARGERRARTILDRMQEVILRAEDARIDYVALVDPQTLQPVTTLTSPTLAALAVKIEETRLIDNCILEP